MANGDTKTESYLRAAAEGTRADLPSDTCCNTKTQNLILGVANRIMDVEDEVEELKNNPDVVDIVDTYADLQAYDTQHLTENDIIRVLQDETHSGNSTYYRFTKNPDTWTFIGEISGGGSSINVVQTTGTSTTDVMSQKAVTDELYPQYSAHTNGVIGIGNYNSIADYGDTKIGIGKVNLGAKSAYALAINSGDGAGTVNAISAMGIWAGTGGSVTGHSGIAIGNGASVSGAGGVAIGANSSSTQQGELNIGTSNTGRGYNNTNYRLITGVHDPVNAHDAATKGYVDSQGGGGGDTVYSSKTTSNSATGGAVYIGNLNSSQEVQPDPTTIDSHYKYFWALPSFNPNKPVSNSINILGNANGQNSISIGSSSGTSASGAVAIGASAISSTDYSLAIGNQANVNTGTRSIALGNATIVNANNGVAIGSNATVTRDGEVNVGAGTSGRGYNSTNYRVIGGVHDPVDAHDVATKGYVDQTLTTLFIDVANLPSDPDIPLTGQCFYKEKELFNAYSLSEIRDRIINGNVRLCVVDTYNLNFYNFTILSCSTDYLTINLQVHDLGDSSVIDFTSDSNTQDEFTFSIYR